MAIQGRAPTFFYLPRHFEGLEVDSVGIDTHPDLRHVRHQQGVLDLDASHVNHEPLTGASLLALLPLTRDDQDWGLNRHVHLEVLVMGLANSRMRQTEARTIKTKLGQYTNRLLLSAYN